MLHPIIVERPRPGVGLVRLNRPERLNSLTTELAFAFREAMIALDDDSEIRAIIVTGEGRAFCSGHDLNEVATFDQKTPGELMMRIDREVEALLTVHTLNTPTIAAVNGPARGGGMSIAAACDIRIVSTAGSFGTHFIKIGISGGDAGLTWTLPRIVGSGIAAELLLTGRIVEAEEAVRIGLANRAVEPEALLPSALELAETIAGMDMLAVWMTKRTLNASGAMSLQDAVAMENTAQIVAMTAPAARARVVAFLKGEKFET